MNSLPKIISIAVLLLIGFASAAEQIYSNTRTKTFANGNFHGFPGLNTKAAAGLGTGFGILGCLMIFACAMIVLEELNKHKDQNNKIRAAHDRMRELGLNLSEIDAEYDE